MSKRARAVRASEVRVRAARCLVIDVVESRKQRLDFQLMRRHSSQHSFKSLRVRACRLRFTLVARKSCPLLATVVVKAVKYAGGDCLPSDFPSKHGFPLRLFQIIGPNTSSKGCPASRWTITRLIEPVFFSPKNCQRVAVACSIA